MNRPGFRIRFERLHWPTSAGHRHPVCWPNPMHSIKSNTVEWSLVMQADGQVEFNHALSGYLRLADEAA